MHETDERTRDASGHSGSAPLIYDEHYYENYWPGTQPYRRDDYWLRFFRGFAERISKDLQPASVLDAGCALGILVETLRDLGIEAWGMDISEWAIAHVHESVRDYCWQGSLTEPLPRKYDLITCIEVIEHLPPAEADVALDNICAAADRVLFSSIPSEFGEATHVNVRAVDDWAALFARRGFLRNLDLDASFVAPWAAVFERSSDPSPEIVRRYERSLQRLREEVRQVREQILTQDQRFRDGEVVDHNTHEQLRLEEELLGSRDTVIGHEMKLGDALGEVRRLEAELVRYETRVEQLDVILRSWTWRVGGTLHRALRRLRGRNKP